MTPKEVIEQIRREEFLIGVELPAEAQKGAQNLRENLDNALRLLSEDLYAKETHFVLELVQNADDNLYPADFAPTIRFELTGEKIAVSNNELGFAEENVRALCSVGKSTKAKRAGFIGEKGIGFKSVFTVTDRPEIHSNGFHFCFDRTGASDRLGFVVPHWLDSASELARAGTQIILPARSGDRFGPRTLAELADDLLLFLRNIRTLEISDALQGTLRVVERRDRGAAVSLSCRITDATGVAVAASTRHFQHVSHIFSMESIKEEKRPDTQESEVVLAFPIDEEGKANADTACQVFAFLPVRDFGFRFLIQGDFLLSSSREDIHRNRPWNERIRDEISKAFISAARSFRTDRRLSRSFLSFVPSKASISDSFFQVVAQFILKELKEEECVLTVSGRWRKPSDVLMADEEFKKLFPSAEIADLLDADYISPEMQVPQEILDSIGVVKVRSGHLLKVLKAHKSLQQKPAEWFIRLYGYCAGKITSEDDFKQLRTLSIVRLEGDTLGTISDEEIFFPLERGRKYGFERELRVVDGAVIDTEDDPAKQRTDFLTRLGVKKANPHSVILNHILRLHASDKWMESGSTALAGHIRYVKDHLEEYIAGSATETKQRSEALTRLRTSLLLQTKKVESGKTYYSRANELYLSEEYAPSFHLEQLLGSKAEPVRLLSPYLLAPKLAETDVDDDKGLKRAWREFLHVIGVNAVPTVSTTTNGLTTNHDAGPELSLLLEAEDIQTRRLVLTLLDQDWAYYSRFLVDRVYAGRNRYRDESSRFVTRIRGFAAPTKRRDNVPLSECYLDDELVRGVFGRSAPYLDVKITSTGFMDAAGVTHRVSPAACFKRLDQLRGLQRRHVKDVKAIYRELEKACERDSASIRTSFQAAPRIYVPAVDQWFYVSSVVWETSGDFVDSLYPPLKPAYWEHQTFFLRYLGVVKQPSEIALINALKQVTKKVDSFDAQKREALRIYRHLSKNLKEARSTGDRRDPTWLALAKSDEIYLDQRQRLISASNDLYLNDNPRLAEALSEHAELSFLAVGREQLPAVMDLVETCEIPTLSSVTKYTLLDAEGALPEEELTQKLRSRRGEILRLIYGRSHHHFRQAGTRMLEQLKETSIFKATSLSLNASVSGHEATLTEDAYRDGTTIYIAANAKAKLDRVSTEICHMLGIKSDLAEAIYRVLSAPNPEELQDFLEVRGVPIIPAEELGSLGDEILEASVVSLPDEMGSGEAQPTDRVDSGAAATAASQIDPSLDRQETSALHEAPPDRPIAGHPATQVETPQIRPDGTNSGLAQPPAPPHVAMPVSQGREVSRSEVHASDGVTNQREPQPLENSLSTSQSSTISRPSQPKASSGRLLSYAEPDPTGHKDEASPDTESDRLETAAAAVAFVLDEERRKGANIREMHHNNEGFDILKRSPDGTDDYIEVKGLTGAWTEVGIALTPAELRYAERHRERYWLYVVEFAKNPDRRRRFVIQDPFGKTTQFRFDSGWKGIAEGRISNIDPRPGLRIAIPDVGTGVIVDVAEAGLLKRVQFRFDDGSTIWRVFDPATMQVIGEQA
jgi:hypothetical protein